MNDDVQVVSDRYEEVDTIANGGNNQGALASADIYLPPAAEASKSDATKWNHMPKKPKQSPLLHSLSNNETRSTDTVDHTSRCYMRM